MIASWTLLILMPYYSMTFTYHDQYACIQAAEILFHSRVSYPDARVVCIPNEHKRR
jgi:hypothetical protein